MKGRGWGGGGRLNKQAYSNKADNQIEGADRIIIDDWITLQMAFWAAQLISSLFQGTSMLAHYCNNWKPAAEACLSDYPGRNYTRQPKPTETQCLDVHQHYRCRDPFFLIKTRSG